MDELVHINELLQTKKQEIKELGQASSMTLGWGNDYLDSAGMTRPSQTQD